MKTRKLILRNLVFFWRTNIAILLGIAVAVAVLTGALLVGQSVRDSLRQLLYQRIGSVDYIVSSASFFGEDLANKLGPNFHTSPIIFLKGVLAQEATQVRAHNVNVYGIDERFWKLNGLPLPESADGQTALVGESLANQLGLRPGDGLLLRVETQQAIPKEWLYGRRDTAGRTIRLKCGKILSEGMLGEFSLRPSQGNVFSIFVPLRRMQKDLAQLSRINAILLAGSGPEHANGRRPTDLPSEMPAIINSLKTQSTLSDLGLRLQNLPQGNGFSLESDRIVLDDAIARSAFEVASTRRIQCAPIYTYLANSLRANNREIPYSVITAADPGSLTFEANPPSDLSSASNSLKPIWLTDWAARDLGVSTGSAVEVDYYLWLESGQLSTRTTRFRLAGILPFSKNIDSSFAPQIPGITEAKSLSAWDPPFPLDLSRIRREDEDFWNQHRATPKAFIPLQQGQVLWGNRFGKLTAIRIAIPQAAMLDTERQQFAKALLEKLDPQQSGFSVADIRRQGADASRGSTDFGEYFLYFSSFLIIAAIILSALFFKLMIEQRAREIGILRATGYPITVLRRIFLTEGLFLSLLGSLLGLAGSLLYGWLMVFGLRTWWVGAVGTQRISLHLSWGGLMAGIASGIAFSLCAVLWTLRRLRHHSPRSLLSGILESAGSRPRSTKALWVTAILFSLFSILFLAGSTLRIIPQMEGFFGSGFLGLITSLCWTALYLRRRRSGWIHGSGWRAFARLGIRNATYRPGRSLVCATLIASATFIIISMEAFRQNPQEVELSPQSGTGGFPLMAEAAIPIVHNPNTEEGREAIGLSAAGETHVNFIPFRERPGDDASCLNLYAPQELRILGAQHSFITSDRFSFQSSLADNEAEKKNPWLLLEKSKDASVIPAIADANTIQYILHRSLGSEIEVRGDNGQAVRLRLVAALRDSIFQGEVLIAEASFLKLFPEHQGYSFFLLDLPQNQAANLRKPVQEALSDWGVSVDSTQERLAAYHRVENTYLSTFQSLGALGLILGTAGLAAILLRNILERRKELALLRATGFSHRVLAGIILFENVVLLFWSLAAGSGCALLAVIPALQTRGTSIPLTVSGLMILSVLIVGLLSSLVAVIAALRTPLIAALHSE